MFLLQNRVERQKMSKERGTSRSRQLRQECESFYSSLQKENTINTYLKRSSRKDPHHLRDLTTLTQNYLSDNVFSGEKESEPISVRYKGEHLERKIEEILQKKLATYLDTYIEKYITKVFEVHRTGLQLFYQSQIQQIETKLLKTQAGHAEMIRNYDNFLAVVDSIREKTKKIDKYVPKIQHQADLESINEEITRMKTKVLKLQKGQQGIKDMSWNLNQPKLPKIEPIVLQSKAEWETSREELKVVVQTFNQNFVRIDDKLKQIMSHLH